MHPHSRQKTAFSSLFEGCVALFASPHRFSFNGKESDSEVKGEGNQQDYGMRVYDNRLGRFLSVDPLTKQYPWYTPYQFAGNKVIIAKDLDGEEEFVIIRWFSNGEYSGTSYLYIKNTKDRLYSDNGILTLEMEDNPENRLKVENSSNLFEPLSDWFTVSGCLNESYLPEFEPEVSNVNSDTEIENDFDHKYLEQEVNLSKHTGPNRTFRRERSGRLSPFSITFDVNSSALSAEAKSTLESLANFLKENSSYTLNIEGHASTLNSDNSSSRNRDLAKQRAESTSAYLISKGVSPDRITKSDFGDSKPKETHGESQRSEVKLTIPSKRK